MVPARGQILHAEIARDGAYVAIDVDAFEAAEVSGRVDVGDRDEAAIGVKPIVVGSRARKPPPKILNRFFCAQAEKKFCCLR